MVYNLIPGVMKTFTVAEIPFLHLITNISPANFLSKLSEVKLLSLTLHTKKGFKDFL